MDYLFIAGCARSGTTALARLLNQGDARILIGIERYKYMPRDIRPAHFHKDKFLNPDASETNILRDDLFERLRKKWASGQLQYIGDKVPSYYRLMPHLAQTFPYCKIIFMLRDLPSVASSFNVRAQNASATWPAENDYRRAVEEWNASLKCLKAFIEAGYDRQVFIVKYERFFAGEKACLTALYDFLELACLPRMHTVFSNFTKNWPTRSSKELVLDQDMRTYLAKHENKALAQWVEDYLNERHMVMDRD